MYPLNSLLRIYDFKIIFHCGSTYRSKYEKPIESVIHGIENMEQHTFLHQRNQFSDMDRYATDKLFCTFDYTLVSNLPNHLHHCQLYQRLLCSYFLSSWTSRFQKEYNLIQIFISCSHHFLYFFRKLFYSFSTIIGILNHQLAFELDFSYLYG